MKNQIKESYEKIAMEETAKQRICQEILQETEENSSVVRRKWNRGIHERWKIAVAACLCMAVLIPSGVYAAGKISEFFRVKIEQRGYQAKIALDKAEEEKGTQEKTKTVERYIRVEADFGKEYMLEEHNAFYTEDENGKIIKQYESVPEGTDGCYSYVYQDGQEAGKDFTYTIIYVDQEKDSIMELYDLHSMKELTIKGHKAFLCVTNTVEKSLYSSKHDTDYTIDLYVFYDEYGYIINYCGMQGLGQEALIDLAGQTKVQKTTKKDASRYELLSFYQKALQERLTGEEGKVQRVEEPVKTIGQKIEHDGALYQVTDVSVSSKVLDMDISRFNSSQFNTEASILWDEKGKLQTYTREQLKEGDGISEPGQSVLRSEKVQLKMVYVTMRVWAGDEDLEFDMPEISFLTRRNGKYYNTDIYWQYNRPEQVENALIDFEPCYVKETQGGKSFWIQRLKAGDERIYHFAYLVDEDLVRQICLCIDNNTSQDTQRQYVDLNLRK